MDGPGRLDCTVQMIETGRLSIDGPKDSKRMVQKSGSGSSKEQRLVDLKGSNWTVQSSETQRSQERYWMVKKAKTERSQEIWVDGLKTWNWTVQRGETGCSYWLIMGGQKVKRSIPIALPLSPSGPSTFTFWTVNFDPFGRTFSKFESFTFTP